MNVFSKISTLICFLFFLSEVSYGHSALSSTLHITTIQKITSIVFPDQKNPDQTSPNFANVGREWYISSENGKGQSGTKEKPARDLGNIIHRLKPNDVIYIAGGIYKSKGGRGADEINVPVKIYGGYDETFSQRDPWGLTKTIFTGTNEYKKLTDPRLYIRIY